MVDSLPENDNEKHIVLIGTPSDDGVNAKIQALGYRYTRRILTSGSANWDDIAAQLKSLREDHRLAGCILLLTDNSIDRCILPSHQDAWQTILLELKKTTSLAFVYDETFESILIESPELIPETFPSYRPNSEDLRAEFLGGLFVRSRLFPEFLERRSFKGDEDGVYYSFDSFDSSMIARGEQFYREKERVEQALSERNQLARRLFDQMIENGVELVPYRTRIERLIRTESFLETTVSGEFLRLYVPNGRYQSEQLASFLRLFEKYLQRIEECGFSIDLQHTEHGAIYIFRRDESTLSLPEFNDAIDRFETLIRMYEHHPQEAANLLASMGIDPTEARQLLSQLTRDHRRLVLDIKHEYESKALLLRQAFENRALETMPPTIGIAGASEDDDVLQSIPKSLLKSLSPGTIEEPMASSGMEVVLFGDISYTLQDRELLDLFEKYDGGYESVQLKSDLELLKDASAPGEARITSRQRISAFLYRMIHMLGYSLVLDYVKYLNSLADEKLV